MTKQVQLTITDLEKTADRLEREAAEAPQPITRQCGDVIIVFGREPDSDDHYVVSLFGNECDAEFPDLYTIDLGRFDHDFDRAAREIVGMECDPYLSRSSYDGMIHEFVSNMANLKVNDDGTIVPILAN